MSAEVAAAPAVLKTEEQKVADVPAVVEATAEETKTAEPAVEAAATTADAPVTADASKADAATTDAAPAAGETTTTEQAKDEHPKETGRKSPSFLPKILHFLKGDKKVKHKKEKKEEKAEAKQEEAAASPADEPAAAEAVVEAAPVVAEAEATPAVVEETPATTEPVKETETTQPTLAEAAAVPLPSATEEVVAVATPRPEKRGSPLRVGRRLSARVTDFFIRKDKVAATPEGNKVEENPPQIEEPAKVEPLDTTAPAAANAADVTTSAKTDEVKHVEGAPPASTPVAAAA